MVSTNVSLKKKGERWDTWRKRNKGGRQAGVRNCSNCDVQGLVRNISLSPLTGRSLAAAGDVFHPPLAPAVSFDIACRSTRVKRDFPTNGVKPGNSPDRRRGTDNCSQLHFVNFCRMKLEKLW